jgi:hypothetical protein
VRRRSKSNNDTFLLESVDDDVNKISNRAAKNVMLARVGKNVALDLPKKNSLAWALQIGKPLLGSGVGL